MSTSVRTRLFQVLWNEEMYEVCCVPQLPASLLLRFHSLVRGNFFFVGWLFCWTKTKVSPQLAVIVLKRLLPSIFPGNQKAQDADWRVLQWLRQNRSTHSSSGCCLNHFHTRQGGRWRLIGAFRDSREQKIMKTHDGWSQGSVYLVQQQPNQTVKTLLVKLYK